MLLPVVGAMCSAVMIVMLKVVSIVTEGKTGTLAVLIIMEVVVAITVTEEMTAMVVAVVTITAVMTGLNTVIDMMTVAIVVIIESIVMEVDVVLQKEGVAVGALLPGSLILPVKSARNMGILQMSAGGAMLIVMMMMMMMKTTRARKREHMELTPTGTWTLVQLIISRDS
jgi:hypothetical protein